MGKKEFQVKGQFFSILLGQDVKKIAVLIGLVFLIVGYKPAPVFSSDIISFGFSLPFTGTLGEEGQKVLDAYKFWAKKMNSFGGILIKGKRYPVELVYYDDKSNPELSAKFYEKLITVDKVDLLLGGCWNQHVSAAKDVLDKYGYPLIKGSTSSGKLLKRGFNYNFSILAKISDEARISVAMLEKLKPKPRTVAIIGSDNVLTTQLCEDFKKFAEKSGFRVAYFELFPVLLEDYSPMVAKVKAKHPDVLFVGSDTQEVFESIIGTMKKLDFMTKALVFSGSPMISEFVRSIGKDGDYNFVTCEWLPILPYKGPVFGTASDFDRIYFKEYNRHPNYMEAAAVAAAVVQQLALQKSGMAPPYDARKRSILAEQLHTLTFQTFFGDVHFGINGTNMAHSSLVAQVQKGSVIPVFPETMRRAAPAYPVPGWGKR